MEVMPAVKAINVPQWIPPIIPLNS
jgi:hypothetical protein